MITVSLLQHIEGGRMRAIITSSTNPKVKLAAGLHQKKHRESNGLFLAEGLRLAEMALDSGWEIQCCYYTEAAASAKRVNALLVTLEESCPLYEVPDHVFRRISETDSPQGVLLVMKQPEVFVELEELLKKECPLIAVLDNVRDPGNVGTILRTADAVAVDGVVLLGDTADIFSSKTVRSSMGSVFHVPVVSHVTYDAFFGELERRKIPLLAAALDSSADIYFRQDLSGAAVIVFGNEANGVSGDVLTHSKKIYIPIRGKAESLNVASAAAVILYEAFRQRSLL